MINSKILSKLWNLIPTSQKKRTPLLLVLIFCGMLFEVFGLGILFPIVIGMLDVTKVRGFLNQNLEILAPYTENIADLTFIYLGLFAMVALYTLKSGFLIYLTYVQNDYLTKVVRYKSDQLFSNYFDQDYIYFTRKNSSSIVKLFQLELNYLMSYLSSLTFVITEVCMALAIVATLIALEPLGALLVALFFGGLSFLFYSYFRQRLSTYGKQRESIDETLAKNILESFQSVKEIKLNNCSAYFDNIHKQNNARRTQIIRNQFVLGQLPRLFLEVVAVMGLSLFIITLLWQGEDTAQMVSILTLFVAGSFRMIPSLNRVLNGVQNMRYLNASIDVLHKEFSSLKRKNSISSTKKERLKPNVKIRFDNISFGYTEKTKILDGINLDIPVGNTIGIIGESGVGKTTFLDVIIGLLPSQSGHFFIDDHEVTSENIIQWQKNIGYVSQLITLTDDTIKKNIAFGIEDDQIDDNKMSTCISKAQLKDFIEVQEKGLETIVGERGIKLSGGQRQRIGIARALYHDPEVLIFDEATSALDQTTEVNFMSAIEQFKGDKTIIIVTHRLSTLRFCDSIYEIKNTKLEPIKNILNELH